MAKQTGCNTDRRFKPKTTRTSKPTRGIMPESFEGTIKEGPLSRAWNRLV